MNRSIKMFFSLVLLVLIPLKLAEASENENYDSNGVTSFYGKYEVTDKEENNQTVSPEQENQDIVPMYENNQKIIPITGDNPMNNARIAGIMLILIIFIWIMKERKMNKNKLKFTIVALIGSTIIGGNISQAAEYDSNMILTFEPDTEITKPVSPTNPDPEKPIVPVDPTKPEGPTEGTGGPLSIDYASGLHFGTQKITTVDKTYYAQLQEYTDFEGETLRGPNFIQVTDKRGTQSGWELSVKENDQFKTSEEDELIGAKVSLLNGLVNSNMNETYAPNGLTSVHLVPGVEQTVVTATEKKGMGTWIYHFGADENQGRNSVILEVPGESVKLAKEYATTLTWSLKEVPSN